MPTWGAPLLGVFDFVGQNVPQQTSRKRTPTDWSARRYGTDEPVSPQFGDLESRARVDIGELLNPPYLFPDTSRMAAEAGTMRGVAGSPAAASTAVRMTDEERLRRMALGSQLLTASYERGRPYYDPTSLIVTPAQRAQNDLQRYIANLHYGNQQGRTPAIQRMTPTIDLSGLAGFDEGGGAEGGWSFPEGYFDIPRTGGSDIPAGTYYDPNQDVSYYDPLAQYFPPQPPDESFY